MSDKSSPSRAHYLKLGGYLVLAFLVAFSWLGLGFVTGFDPGGFAIDGSGTAAAEPEQETVAAEHVREALKRTNRGGKSTTSMSAIWATDAYFAASDVGPADVGVNTADTHVFVVFLNTHTGRLAELDWQRDATLHVDDRAIDPVEGKMIAGGYHHGTAVVAFPKTIDGTPTIPNSTESVTLSVIGLERVESDLPDDRSRNVSWEYPPPYYDIPSSAIVKGDCNCTATPDESSSDSRGTATDALVTAQDRYQTTPPEAAVTAPKYIQW